MYYTHRGRIKTEKKAKVVAAVWGTEMNQFLVALAICHQDELKKRMNRLRLLGGMDVLEKWMIMGFSPYQSPPPLTLGAQLT